ncbi:hypothetical protein B0O99DRAFT_642917 [Bisporella sp. PMI_857]|nr:hypothetical protein B0O99DRAFT_642917 [Bisporella sp. PMI_857]
MFGTDAEAKAVQALQRTLTTYCSEDGPSYQEWAASNARSKKQKTDFRIRLLIAASAGLALIVPMLIMTLHRTKLTSLLTTSFFVIAVAIVLAYVMEDAQNKDIVAATAAYAAVLVVFVGTAMTPSG